MIDQKRAYQLLQDIGFVRNGGTAEELRAAELLKERLEAEGLSARIEPFETQASTIQEVSFTVTKPYQKTYQATAYAYSKETPVEGITADLLYYEAENDVLKKQAKNKIVLVNGYVTMRSYKQFNQTGAIGFVTYNGDIDHPQDFDLHQMELRSVLKEQADMPGIHLKVEDAMELVEKKASEVHIVVRQTPYVSNSHNVICEIDGTENEETIVCTAHYDSSSYSHGYYDNATGSVCLYEMALYFAKHQPRHHIRFVWCGSEERGLLGSKAYCEAHKEELEAVKLCVNIDMIGSIMGKRIAVSTAEEALVHYIDYFAKEIGYPIDSSQGVYSSDSTSLANEGIPAVSFARITTPGTGSIHSRNDVLCHLSDWILAEDIDFICAFTERMANAYTIPVKRELPQNMREEVDKYLGKKKKEA